MSSFSYELKLLAGNRKVFVMDTKPCSKEPVRLEGAMHLGCQGDKFRKADELQDSEINLR